MPTIFDVRDKPLRSPGRPAGIVAVLIAVALVGSACSGGSSSGPPAPRASSSTDAVLVNHAAYRFATAYGLAWYILPPRNKQRACHPSCTAQVVRPAFRSNVIASVDTVPAQHRTWRLIVQLRRPAAKQLARVTRHRPRGSELVIAVGSHYLVHAPLREPIVSGVWQISGLSRASAMRIARVLQSIAHGYPRPPRHHKTRHHRRHRHHRHHHRRHRHHHRRHHHHH